MKKEKYIISVDWFQVSARRNPGQVLEDGVYLEGRTGALDGKTIVYRLTRASEFNAMFDGALAITMAGFQLATIFFKPRTSVMLPSVCSIKMSNAILYAANWAFYLVDIANALRWKINNISRVDVCADFVTFADGLEPREFIRRYLRSGAFDPLKPSYHRVGSNKYETIGRKAISKESDSTIVLSQNDYLRFGSRSTGVSVYLYNKSEELRQSGGKLYIADMWRREGLIPQSVESEGAQPDVFRLEISILANGLNVKRVRNKEDKDEVRASIAMISRKLKPFDIVALSYNDFQCQLNIEDVFWSYAAHYFRFKVVGPQRYPHNWQDLRLFDAEIVPSMKPYHVSRSLDTYVSFRNATKCIEKVLEGVESLTVSQIGALETTILTLQHIGSFTSVNVRPEDVNRIVSLIRDGFSFEEIKKMRVMDSSRLDSLRELIAASTYERLRDVMMDGNVARALDEYEYTKKLVKEQYELMEEAGHES